MIFDRKFLFSVPCSFYYASLHLTFNVLAYFMCLDYVGYFYMNMINIFIIIIIKIKTIKIIKNIFYNTYIEMIFTKIIPFS